MNARQRLLREIARIDPAERVSVLAGDIRALLDAIDVVEEVGVGLSDKSAPLPAVPDAELPPFKPIAEMRCLACGGPISDGAIIGLSGVQLRAFCCVDHAKPHGWPWL